MENDEVKEDSVSNELSGMMRASKLFLKVDKDGFLSDSIAISDVVNFDCYESIVTSAQRIISLFCDLKQSEVQIDMLFYYKKRSRATRMNPVPLVTTTDGFRAVAEHPTGEVPLGIVWCKSSALSGLVNNTVGEKRSRSASPAADNDAEAPEKKKKLDAPFLYKTYLPGTSESSSVSASTATSKGTETILIHKVRRSNTSRPEVQNAEGSSLKSLLFNSLKSKEKVADEAKKSTGTKESHQYQWSGDVSMEVLLHYDGVTERKKLKPKIASIVEKLIRGNYTVLRDDLASKLRQEELLLSSQETIKDMTYLPYEKDEPIKYVDQAKLEILKVLSLVNLTKARFKDLLDWMKTLKLEQGKQGKFFLSERNVLGGGLRVTYDTDEQAAAALNNLRKSRSKTKPLQKLYSVTSLQQPINVLPANQQQMIMLHNTAGGLVTSTGQTFIPVTLTNKQGQGHQEKSKDSDVRISNSVSLQSTSTSVTASTSEAQKSSRFPNILRGKAQSHTQKSGHSGNSLSRKPPPSSKNKLLETTETSNTESDSSQSEPPLVVIKQEPVDTYEQTLDCDQRDSYKKVLRSDPHLGQSEDMNTDVVIKMERVDDYEPE